MYELKLKLAIERIKNEAISLADAQVIALEALNEIKQPNLDSRALFEARLDKMQKEGDIWITIPAVFAILTDCDNKQYELENAFYNKPSVA